MKRTNPEFLMLLGAVSQMSKEEQEEVQKIKNDLQEVLDRNKDLGIIALTIVGMELQLAS